MVTIRPRSSAAPSLPRDARGRTAPPASARRPHEAVQPEEPVHTSGARACAIGSPMMPRTRVSPVIVAGAVRSPPRSRVRRGRRPRRGRGASGQRREGRLDRRQCLLHLSAPDAVHQHDRVERLLAGQLPQCGLGRRPRVSRDRHAHVHARHAVMGEHPAASSPLARAHDLTPLRLGEVDADRRERPAHALAAAGDGPAGPAHEVRERRLRPRVHSAAHRGARGTRPTRGR